MQTNIVDALVDVIKDKPNWHLHLNVSDIDEQFDITLVSPEIDITLDLVENSVYIYYHGYKPEQDDNDIAKNIEKKYSDILNALYLYMATANINQLMCFYSSIYFSGQKQFIIYNSNKK